MIINCLATFKDLVDKLAPGCHYCQLFRHNKAPHNTSSHHERNVVTECDYLFGPPL